MPIKVVSIISRMNVGGPAVLLRDLINGLNSDDFEHNLITGVCLPNEIDYLASHRVNGSVHYLSAVQRSILPIRDVLGLFALIKLLRKISPDIVHTHTSKAGVLGRIATRIAAPRAKIVHTYHGHVLYGYFPKYVTRMVVILERYLAKLTNVLIAITSAVEMDLRKVGIGQPKQWRKIRLGVNIEPRHDRKVASQKSEIVPDEKILLWIGRFASVKNPMLALRAVSRIREFHFKSVRLIMVGDGDLLNECKTFAVENELNVDFVGWSDDIFSYLSAADLLLLTSNNEGMGMVILEAATQEVPTLATDVGGVSEFIQDGKTGFLTSLNAHEFAEKLSEILSREDLLRTVGHNARELVSAEFSRELFVQNHINLYKELYSPIKSA